VAIVASATLGVVALHRPCFCVARSARVDTIAGVAVPSLSVRVKDPLPDRRSTLVGRLPGRTVCMDGCLLALGVVVIPGATLPMYTGR
jgi:hypothetical protein